MMRLSSNGSSKGSLSEENVLVGSAFSVWIVLLLMVSSFIDIAVIILSFVV